MTPEAEAMRDSGLSRSVRFNMTSTGGSPAAVAGKSCRAPRLQALPGAGSVR